MLERVLLLAICAAAYVVYGVATMIAYDRRSKDPAVEGASSMEYFTGWWMIYPLRHQQDMAGSSVRWTARVSLAVAIGSLFVAISRHD